MLLLKERPKKRNYVNTISRSTSGNRFSGGKLHSVVAVVPVEEDADCTAAGEADTVAGVAAAASGSG